MPHLIHTAADAPSVAQAFTRYFIDLIADKARVNIALSGGSTPKLLFQLWARDYADQIDWSRLHFFWGDERCVAPDDAASNFGMTKSLLFDHINIPEENIHRIRGEDDPETEAVRYGAEIQAALPAEGSLPVFDLIILGMGDDGHTASIFPHQMELLTVSKICAVATHPRSGQQRITLSGPVIQQAQQIAFLVTGANKSDKIASVIQRQGEWQSLPAAHIQPFSGELHWFLDKAAANRLGI